MADRFLDYREYPYLPKLEKIYREYSSMKGFPSQWCYDIMQRLETEGFRGRNGVFRVDVPQKTVSGEMIDVIQHHWNIDDHGNIIDFTASQFNRWLHEPFPSGVLIIRPDDPRYVKYVSTSHFPQVLVKESNLPYRE